MKYFVNFICGVLVGLILIAAIAVLCINKEAETIEGYIPGCGNSYATVVVYKSDDSVRYEFYKDGTIPHPILKEAEITLQSGGNWWWFFLRNPFGQKSLVDGYVVYT